MLCKRRMRGGMTDWRPVSFVAGKKLVLMRDIRELHVRPTPEALRALDQLPDTFGKWLRAQGAGEISL